MKKIGLFSLTLMSLAMTAHADDVSQLKAQIQALQQQIRSMQQSGIERGVQSAEGAANVERIRREFQSLQGSFDAVQFKLQNLQDSLNRYQQDTDSRLRALEEKLDIMGKAGGAKTGAVDTAPSATATGEATIYQRGLSQVRDGNYAQAAASFREFLQKYPKSSFAGNAQYWLAECFYAQKDFQRAIKEYQATITLYPKLDKIPSAKLKQGLAFADLGMTNDAVLFLQKLVKEYPGTPEARKAEDRIKVMTQTRSPAAPTKRPEDNIPLAPGAVKPKAEITPLPLNQSPIDR